ncbi:MAG: histidine phosphatase family protein, partial [Thiomargarita sp.]|nr:histidine phosphatase family protein [Thiomargarita sp.]
PLKQNFLAQFESIQQRLPSIAKDNLLISSPLQRCIQLADYLKPPSILIDKRIMELNFGDWEMQQWNNIARDLIEHWSNDCVYFTPPNGENFHSLFKRCQLFWYDLVSMKTQTIFIITHLGVIRALLALILEIPLKNALLIQINYGAISQLSHHFDIQTQHSWTTINYLNKT